MRVPILALFLLAAAAGPVAAGEPGGEAARDLHRLFEAEWERGLRESPVQASYLGDRRYNDRWPDLSATALAASHAADEAVLEALAVIPADALDAEDRLNRELFARQYRGELDA